MWVSEIRWLIYIYMNGIQEVISKYSNSDCLTVMGRSLFRVSGSLTRAVSFASLKCADDSHYGRALRRIVHHSFPSSRIGLFVIWWLVER